MLINLEKLILSLEKESTPDQILGPLFISSLFHQIKDYSKSLQAYHSLTVGNKPWTIGLQEEGVYEKTGKCRLLFSQINRQLKRHHEQSHHEPIIALF